MELGDITAITINAATVELSGAGSTFTAIDSLADNQGSFTLRASPTFSTRRENRLFFALRRPRTRMNTGSSFQKAL